MIIHDHTEQEVLDRINEIILEEEGSPITMEGKFQDVQLDSLGMLMLMVSIDAEFSIFDGKSEEELQNFDHPGLTTKELVSKCVLSDK